MLFSFLAKASPAKFNQTVATINWEQISVTFGDDWSNLFHDAEVFLGVCFHRTEHRAAITKLIEWNTHRIEVLAPRLALTVSMITQTGLGLTFDAESFKAGGFTGGRLCHDCFMVIH
jgi:hypothetical protein